MEWEFYFYPKFEEMYPICNILTTVLLSNGLWIFFHHLWVLKIMHTDYSITCAIWSSHILSYFLQSYSTFCTLSCDPFPGFTWDKWMKANPEHRWKLPENSSSTKAVSVPQRLVSLSCLSKLTVPLCSRKFSLIKTWSLLVNVFKFDVSVIVLKISSPSDKRNEVKVSQWIEGN